MKGEVFMQNYTLSLTLTDALEKHNVGQKVMVKVAKLEERSGVEAGAKVTQWG